MSPACRGDSSPIRRIRPRAQPGKVKRRTLLSLYLSTAAGRSVREQKPPESVFPKGLQPAEMIAAALHQSDGFITWGRGQLQGAGLQGPAHFSG